MEQIKKLTQEQYDKLKIFLIANFNIRFLQNEQSDIVESFEINEKNGNIIGNFHVNNSLELNSSENVSSSHQKILDEIYQLTEENIKSESLSHVDDLSDYKAILEHVFTCEQCKTKLLEILKHAKTRS